jgi:hypothetical protein
MAAYGPLSAASLGIIGRGMQLPAKRRIFVSYHHGGDQWYYNEFSRAFHDTYEAVFDNSLERQIDSDNTAYVMRRIRDNYITGTSCTVVLIGGQTHQRKYVDWEIKATLDKQHGLLGIVLPSHSRNAEGKIIVPDRFQSNVVTGYANYMFWENLNAQTLASAVHTAASASSSLIDNSMQMKSRETLSNEPRSADPARAPCRVSRCG